MQQMHSIGWIINTYHNNSRLFIDGQYVLSKEGTTQGDPLAMAMYADDSAASSSLKDSESSGTC